MPLRAIDGQQTYRLDEFHVQDETGELEITISGHHPGKVRIWFQRKGSAPGVRSAGAFLQASNGTVEEGQPGRGL